MSLLVVGTIAYDSIETPSGRVNDEIGAWAKILRRPNICARLGYVIELKLKMGFGLGHPSKGATGMPFGLQPTHLIIIAVVALIIFGPSRLPEIGRAIGKTLKEFQAATKEATQSFTEEVAKPGEVKKIEPASALCKSCSKPIQPGVKFCPECGAAQ